LIYRQLVIQVDPAVRTALTVEAEGESVLPLNAIPVLGNGKVDLRGVKALAASSSPHVEAEAQM